MKMNLPQVLVDIECCIDKSVARRVIIQGAVSVNGYPCEDINREIFEGDLVHVTWQPAKRISFSMEGDRPFALYSVE